MKHWMITASAIAFMAAGTAQAQDTDILKQQYATIYGGVFDVNDDETTGMAGFEYQGSAIYDAITPIVGLKANFDNGYYGYAGLMYNWQPFERFVVQPNFSVGGYAEESSKDLGTFLEFQSGIRLGYVLDNLGVISVGLDHLSNAGLDSDNPGTETVFMGYSHPL